VYLGVALGRFLLNIVFPVTVEGGDSFGTVEGVTLDAWEDKDEFYLKGVKEFFDRGDLGVDLRVDQG
jgi:hypothetical protein